MKGQNSSRYEFTIFHVPDLYLDVFSFCLLPFLYLLCLLLRYISNSFVVEDCEGLVEASALPVRNGRRYFIV